MTDAKRWVVFGSSGLLGSEFAARLSSQPGDHLLLRRGDLDLEISAQEIANRISGADVLVNCIAYTKVDKAEVEPDDAFKLNAHLPGKLASAAAILRARFIHFSTDYVFDGAKNSPYQVDDEPNPQTTYGKSKREGELAVAASAADHSTIRTSWLYGAHGPCFPMTIAQKLQSEVKISVVSDQYGSPTWTKDLVELTVNLVTLPSIPRLVHGSASGATSWFGFAEEISKFMRKDRGELASIEPVDSSAYLTPAVRPKYSVLDNSSCGQFAIEDWAERWRVAAPEVLREPIPESAN